MSRINFIAMSCRGPSLLLISMGDAFITYLSNTERALQNYKATLGLAPNICGLTSAERSDVVRKIRNLEPGYQPPTFNNTPARTSSTPTTTSSGGCYVATAVYGTYDCPQVWTLRRYRDYALAGTWYSRAFIRTYYAVSPTLVKWFGKTEWFKNMWKPTLDRMVEKLRAEGVEDTPYQDRQW